MAGLTSATIINQVETVSLFFEASQPFLTGLVTISVVTYNILNIIKLKNKK